ncbi:MAG: cytochrome P450 [Acidimicrobiales bacterium]|nr:cytochrome P450 [Acidimicrobiales bacterium]
MQLLNSSEKVFNMTTLVFDPFAPEHMRAPFATYARLRDEAPVHFQPWAQVPATSHAAAADPGGGFYVLSRFDDVFAAARDTETFSSAEGLSLDGGDRKALGLAPTIVMMDPPEHTAYRRLVSRGFTPRAVAPLEPEVRAFVRARLDVMAEELAATGETDLIAGLAGPLPSFVVAHYLGVPPEDRDRFDRWTAAIVAANAGGDVLADALEAVTDLYGYLTELLERRRREPGDDMISTLVQASLGDEEVSPEAVLGYAFVMVAGGNDTATGLLGGAAELLAAHPDQRRALRDDPSLIDGALEELLRLTSPVQGLSRAVTRDVEVRGTTIPAGSRVHLLYGAANRDPREFGADADALDIGRSIAKILTFTSGPHYCLGSHAARLQGRVALEELLERFGDYELDLDRAAYAPGAFVRRFETLPLTAPPAP